MFIAWVSRLSAPRRLGLARRLCSSRITPVSLDRPLDCTACTVVLSGRPTRAGSSSNMRRRRITAGLGPCARHACRCLTGSPVALADRRRSGVTSPEHRRAEGPSMVMFGGRRVDIARSVCCATRTHRHASLLRRPPFDQLSPALADLIDHRRAPSANPCSPAARSAGAGPIPAHPGDAEPRWPIVERSLPVSRARISAMPARAVVRIQRSAGAPAASASPAPSPSTPPRRPWSAAWAPGR